MITKASLLGGDLRQLYLASSLCNDGIQIRLYGFDDTYIPDDRLILCEGAAECLEDAELVILPLPYNCDEGLINAPLSKYNIVLDSVLQFFPENALVVGGCFDEKTTEKIESTGCTVIDYFKREELSILNAIPTSEGILQIALEELPVTIHGTKVLVTGFGTVGKQAVSTFKALGAKVYVFARKPADLATIKVRDCIPVTAGELAETAGNCKLIVNTVPATIFTKDILPSIADDALMIDIASKPGGVDMHTANTLGKKVIWALSLPGKVAPVTSGEIIKSTIYNILADRETK